MPQSDERKVRLRTLFTVSFRERQITSERYKKAKNQQKIGGNSQIGNELIVDLKS